MADFQGALKKFGLNNFEVQLLDHHNSVWPNRNGQKLTRVIFHTEGLASKISGKADRNIRDYFNNPINPNTHGYITFSGKLYIYQAMENGCWGAGNDDDNVQAAQFETQDNGYWAESSTYTNSQYDTWKRVYCAVKYFAKEKYGTDIQFDRSVWGGRRHNEIDTGRACPGALDVDRIIREAKVLWEEVMNPKPSELELLKQENKLLKAGIADRDTAITKLEGKVATRDNMIKQQQEELEKSLLNAQDLATEAETYKNIALTQKEQIEALRLEIEGLKKVGEYIKIFWKIYIKK